MTHDEVQIREAIRQTVAIYNSAVDRGAYEELRSAFTPDATMIFNDTVVFNGIDAIVSGMAAGAVKRGHHEPGNFQRHVVGNGMIKVIDSATAQAVHFVILMTERGFDSSGAYKDEYVRVGDRWLFTKRHANIEWVAPGSRFESFPSTAAAFPPEQIDMRLAG